MARGIFTNFFTMWRGGMVQFNFSGYNLNFKLSNLTFETIYFLAFFCVVGVQFSFVFEGII